MVHSVEEVLPRRRLCYYSLSLRAYVLIENDFFVQRGDSSALELQVLVFSIATKRGFAQQTL